MSPSFFLVLLLFFTSACTLDFRYHNNREIEAYLLQVSKDNPDITHLYSIGKSVKGQQLWVIALGVSPRQHTVGIPEFKYVGNMHGNEVLGRVLLLQLIDDLVRGYRANQTWSLQLLNSMRIHVLPTMNPDGFDNSDTDCQYTQGRFNQNGVDLNRNFPDAFDVLQQQLNDQKREAEVRAVIGWLKSETFVLSANLHGGALVASYPYDNSNGGGELMGTASVSPDNDVFVHLSKIYSQNHATMHLGNQCADSGLFLDGITNGYEWYPLKGGMQDYNYVWSQCLEVTLEVSCCKFPPAVELPVLWADNRKSLLSYMKQVHLGVKGQVMDGSGTPVENAVVEVKGRKNLCPFRTNQHGEYYRLLLPGNYTFTVTYPGHQVLTETLTVPFGPDLYSAMKHNFMLRRLSTAAPPSNSSQIPASSICLEGGAVTTTPTWRTMVLGISLAVVLRSLVD